MTGASEDLFCAGPFFLQRLFPNETLYSWCARYHRLSGNRLARDTSLQLFGSATAGFWHDLPSHLGAFADRTRIKLGTAEHLCRRHTLLSYYIPFRSPTLIQESINAMTGKSVRDLKFRLGLPSSRVGVSHPLKACPHCMVDDVAETGIAYWHLDHQYPSVWMCPQHGGKLMQCTSRTKTTQRLQWVLPDMVEKESWADFNAPQETGLRSLQKLAQVSCDAVQFSGPNVDQNVLRTCCLQAAQRSGWLLESGRANLTSIREAFQDYAVGVRYAPGLEFVSGVIAQDGGFLGSMLRSDRAHKHPVKYLTLIAFFFDSWEEFVKSVSERGCGSDGRSLVEADPRRLLLAQKVSHESLSVSEAARQLAIPFAKAIYWAKKDNLPFERRPRIIDARLAKLVNDGLESGLNCEEVASQSGTTIDAVRRYRDTHAAARTAWNAARATIQREKFRQEFLKVLRANPNAHQTQLRKTPGSHFDWLRLHDLEWLATHLPNLWRSIEM